MVRRLKTLRLMVMTRLNGSTAPRAWQRMLSGRRLDLLDPSPFDIEIEDIAHGLARVARWNGQTSGTYAFSVAQHSLAVLDICAAMKPDLPPRWQLAALLHDAPEYVIGDLISPFKAAVGLDYKAFETRIQSAIHIRFGVPPEPPKTISTLIKRADRMCAYYEAVALAGFTEGEARKFFGAPRLNEAPDLTPRPVREAEKAFLAGFHTISKRLNGAG
jgi:5'-deoxynucleotidase YfbR-like HD superfamily hydrolase